MGEAEGDPSHDISEFSHTEEKRLGMSGFLDWLLHKPLELIKLRKDNYHWYQSYCYSSSSSSSSSKSVLVFTHLLFCLNLYFCCQFKPYIGLLSGIYMPALKNQASYDGI